MIRRLMAWCVPDEALRWGELTKSWSKSLDVIRRAGGMYVAKGLTTPEQAVADAQRLISTMAPQFDTTIPEDAPTLTFHEDPPAHPLLFRHPHSALLDDDGPDEDA